MSRKTAAIRNDNGRFNRLTNPLVHNLNEVDVLT